MHIINKAQRICLDLHLKLFKYETRQKGRTGIFALHMRINLTSVPLLISSSCACIIFFILTDIVMTQRHRFAVQKKCAHSVPNVPYCSV